MVGKLFIHILFPLMPTKFSANYCRVWITCKISGLLQFDKIFKGWWIFSEIMVLYQVQNYMLILDDSLPCIIAFHILLNLIWKMNTCFSLLFDRKEFIVIRWKPMHFSLKLSVGFCLTHLVYFNCTLLFGFYDIDLQWCNINSLKHFLLNICCLDPNFHMS